jgi:hypothetical protein
MLEIGMPGQLHLFKSKRQRGTAPPSASEFQLQCAVVDTVRRWISPVWIFTHIPSGERRDPITAGRLKRMGVVPGFPDLLFVGPDRRICWIELKAKGGGRLSADQGFIAARLIAAGHGYLCSSDYRDIIETLKGWGVLRSGITVQ